MPVCNGFGEPCQYLFPILIESRRKAIGWTARPGSCESRDRVSPASHRPEHSRARDAVSRPLHLAPPLRQLGAPYRREFHASSSRIRAAPHPSWMTDRSAGLAAKEPEFKRIEQIASGDRATTLGRCRSTGLYGAASSRALRAGRREHPQSQDRTPAPPL
jgi:hypothetical protein